MKEDIEHVVEPTWPTDYFKVLPEVLILDKYNNPEVSTQLVQTKPLLLGAKLKYLYPPCSPFIDRVVSLSRFVQLPSVHLLSASASSILLFSSQMSYSPSCHLIRELRCVSIIIICSLRHTSWNSIQGPEIIPLKISNTSKFSFIFDGR